MPDIQQRIAAIIRGADGDHTMGAAALAEVIASELGLEPTYVTGWMGATGMVRVTPPMWGEAWPEEPAKRYVRWGTTKWVADE